MTTNNPAVALSKGGILTLGLLSSAVAEMTSKQTAAKADTTRVAKASDTAQDHLALADGYKNKQPCTAKTDKLAASAHNFAEFHAMRRPNSGANRSRAPWTLYRTAVNRVTKRAPPPPA